MVTDGLGSVRTVVDSNADILESRVLDPYGQLITQNGTNQTAYGFTGEWTDDTGMSHLRARYYDPSVGTFASLDPFEGYVEYPMSLNGYGYVEGNVINDIDPTGEFPATMGMVSSWLPTVMGLSGGNLCTSNSSNNDMTIEQAAQYVHVQTNGLVAIPILIELLTMLVILAGMLLIAAIAYLISLFGGGGAPPVAPPTVTPTAPPTVTPTAPPTDTPGPTGIPTVPTSQPPTLVNPPTIVPTPIITPTITPTPTTTPGPTVTPGPNPPTVTPTTTSTPSTCPFATHPNVVRQTLINQKDPGLPDVVQAIQTHKPGIQMCVNQRFVDKNNAGMIYGEVDIELPEYMIEYKDVNDYRRGFVDELIRYHRPQVNFLAKQVVMFAPNMRLSSGRRIRLETAGGSNIVIARDDASGGNRITPKEFAEMLYD